MPGRMPSPEPGFKAFAICSGMIRHNVWQEWSFSGRRDLPLISRISRESRSVRRFSTRSNVASESKAGESYRTRTTTSVISSDCS